MSLGRGLRSSLGILALILGLLAPAGASAVLPDEVLDDPVLEGRARDLSRVIRCLVCQNESIDTSNAVLARELRILVRERLTAGDSDAQVLDFLRNAEMALRWTAAGLLEAQKTFRRLKAYRQLPILRNALQEHLRKAQADSAIETIMKAA